MDFAQGFEIFFRIIVAVSIFAATGYRVITALFEREVGDLGGIILLGGLLGLTAMAITHLDSQYFFFFLLGMFIWLGLAFLLPAAFMERERQRMIREDLTRAQQGIDFDPNNVAAYCMLADTYRKMGELDLAIANYRKALELQPTLKRERQRLESALRDKAELASCKRPLPGDSELSSFRRCLALPHTLVPKIKSLPVKTILIGVVILVAAFVLLLLLLSHHPWLGMLLFLTAITLLLRALSKAPAPPKKG